ncbi:MAG: sugar transferase [Vicinamibacterales bacterium]
MTLQWAARRLLLVVFETALIVLAVGLAAYVRLGSDLGRVITDEHGIWKAVLVAGVAQVCLYYADLYDFRVVSSRQELLLVILQAIGAASFILAALYYWFPGLIIGRGVFVLSALFTIVTLYAWRWWYGWLGDRMSRARLLLVGTGAAAISLAEELYARRQELGVSIVGFVDPDPARVGESLVNPGIIGTVEDIPRIVHDHHVDRVVVSLADARGKLPMDRLLEMKLQRGVAFDHLASVYEEYTGKIAVENLRPSWLIFSEGFKKTRLQLAAKRAMDIVCAVTGLILAMPLMLVVAALIKLTSPGPVLYHQRRVGLHGRVFTVHKFRSMRQDAEKGTGAVWAQANDSRVTRLGRFLRRTRLDETPQLFNVLTGEMSMVGPRPERPEFVSTLTEQIPFYGLRHNVRPGVTGWAQVSYTYGASVEDALEKLQYDLFYAKHLTLPFDLMILLSTIKTVLLRRGAQ